MKSWMPPAIALSFGAAIVGLALLGKNAAPESPGSVAPAAPEPAEVEAEPAQADAPEAAGAGDPLAEALAAPPAPPQEGYDRLPDGSPVPELPPSAPQTVRFGVVLFEYEGAQPAPGQGATRSRSKAAARSLAQEVIGLAKTDFAQAVEKGDRGSTANAGAIPRGVLEPNLEYLLFTLEKGGVYPEPIETPRGFWILRRIQ
jgi:hypothetical protein